MDAPQLLRPEIFDGLDGIAAGFTTRHGGVSAPPYHALNLGLSTDDAPENVRENRRRLVQAMGFPAERLALAGQMHGDKIKAVVKPGLYRGYDGLVTRTPGLLLGITAADCAAVLLADPEARLVAACHAGWRGAAARLPEKTVAAMARGGARPEQMRAYVSPCISAEHFEVGPEVAEKFDRAFVRRPPGAEKPHVDLKAAVAAQLREAGLPAGAIETSTRCTFAEQEDFFSHRALGPATGRMMGVIGMADG